MDKDFNHGPTKSLHCRWATVCVDDSDFIIEKLSLKASKTPSYSFHIVSLSDMLTSGI